MFLSIWRLIWPIESYEHKKFLPMGAMLFFIQLNSITLKSIKDGLIINALGPESIASLKIYFVLPAALLSLIIYIKLCDLFTPKNIFYKVAYFFQGYFIFFAVVLYPNQDFIQTDSHTIENLVLQYSNFKWIIKLFSKWSLISFYIISELWETMMFTILFQQFCNQIITISEAKRFYPMFGLFASLSLILSSLIINLFFKNYSLFSNDLIYLPFLIIIIMSGGMVIFLYRWISNNILTDLRLFSPQQAAALKKEKINLSLIRNVKIIFNSKYLRLIMLLILSSTISTKLVNGLWQTKINQLYLGQIEYLKFIAQLQIHVGIITLLLFPVGIIILKKATWKTAAMFNPLTMLIIGILFYLVIYLDNENTIYVAGGSLAIIIGTIQQSLIASTAMLFQTTKDITYIPLNLDLKTKGHAVVEITGKWLSGLGYSIIIFIPYILFPSSKFFNSVPYSACILIIMILIWVYAIKVLSYEYEKQIMKST